MFPPVPPADPHQIVEHEPEAIIAWRPYGKWPALLRLAWLFRIFAVLSVVFGILWALYGCIAALVALSNAGNNQQAAAAIGTLAATSAIFSGVISAFVGYIVWRGLAELILLFIAMEKNTRQTRDRLARHHHE
jgi:hypothetical protein